ncbi:hypothetical protein E4K72_16340 [Oxalobacteraceae bacterium OM1]|nr:hypothetical protein E4K72_16340 [Oxalobacteraceae bacterium OM1]
MESNVLKSPRTGKTLIRVATKTTTPGSDTTAKPIEIDRRYIEVIVSDSTLLSTGSQWGHTAITVNGTVYSRAHGEYVTASKDAYFHGGQFMTWNGPRQRDGNGYRDNVGIVLWLSEREERLVESELKRRVQIDREFKRKHPDETTYSIFSNSCSSNVADVLELTGILAHDPRWLPFPTTPAEVLTALSKSNRFVRRIAYPKHRNKPPQEHGEITK